MEYKVVPFIASIDQNKGKPTDVAQQLEEIINQNSNQGWKYIRLESVTTLVQPENGCFGIGSKPGFTTSKQMLIFYKP